ncbi:precorrin-6Y C5,15-methyltransferase (decarboxylating) [Dethiosulfatibacter aminovorans DSM 17477]|uniref:Precorrin-6Y C5,15-methyltransferase (Decarboxylating) n=1 Tax=Dethiosulfatibacter aminovorans DSM 17477 TaxID=1121476 RepID=A0A1M6B3N2_9FIRM|nr:precorrin-6y C5,15-methyltransferase (decarboxylating) subunit CbiE [Dethiosulfatibacter aminovorans]SHI43063.1 precorrin-6Y C5,15-methyltransferase (decarboxylating) [Dethiosulfatibacter aminovorans DSM 17477]
MDKINIIGMGPGSSKYVLPVSREIIEAADMLIGSKRYIDDYCSDGQKSIVLDSNYPQVVEYLKGNMGSERIAILVSGDSSFYSLTTYIKKNIDVGNLNIVPGISSLQYLFSRIGISYERTLLTSLHGREEDFWERSLEFDNIGILTDKKWSPERIAKEIIRRKLDFKYIYVGENLTYENEKVSRMTMEECLDFETDNINAVVISND